MVRVKIVILLIFIILFTSCSSNMQDELSIVKKVEIEENDTSSTKTKLSVVHYFTDAGSLRWLERSFDYYMQNNEDIAFQVEAIQPEDYDAILSKYFASGKMPDFYFLSNLFDSLAFIEKGFAIDLTDQRFMYDQFLFGYLRGVSYKNKLWAVPIELNGYGVIYNKDIFNRVGIGEIPTTYSEFIEVCTKIKRVHRLPIVGGYFDQWSIMEDLNSDLAQSSYLNNTDWRISIEKNLYSWEDNYFHLKEALLRLKERQKFYNRDAFDTSWYDATKMIAEGDGAMIIGGFSSIEAIKTHNENANIGVFPFPWSEDFEKNNYPIRTTGGIIGNAKSKDTEMLINVLKYFSSKEVGGFLQKYKKTPSVVKGVDRIDEEAYDEFFKYREEGKTVDYSFYKDKFENIAINRLYQDMVVRFLQDEEASITKYIEQLDFETQYIID